MSAMHITSIVAGLIALLGAVVAFRFLPSRREDDESPTVTDARAPAESVPAA